jgi:hypothetical protein
MQPAGASCPVQVGAALKAQPVAVRAGIRRWSLDIQGGIVRLRNPENIREKVAAGPFALCAERHSEGLAQPKPADDAPGVPRRRRRLRFLAQVVRLKHPGLPLLDYMRKLVRPEEVGARPVPASQPDVVAVRERVGN